MFSITDKLHQQVHVYYFRTRRRIVRETKNITSHHEGLSSDDEENQSEITKYNQERGGDLYSLLYLLERYITVVHNVHYICYVLIIVNYFSCSVLV